MDNIRFEEQLEKTNFIFWYKTTTIDEFIKAIKTHREKLQPLLKKYKKELEVLKDSHIPPLTKGDQGGFENIALSFRQSDTEAVGCWRQPRIVWSREGRLNLECPCGIQHYVLLGRNIIECPCGASLYLYAEKITRN